MIDVVVECWDARYEEDIEMLLVFCYIPDMGLKRVLPIRRADMCFHGGEVPHEEMRKTAELWKGKPFKLQITSDDEDESDFMKEKFMIGEIGSQMMEVTDKMSSDEWIMKFKTERLFGGK